MKYIFILLVALPLSALAYYPEAKLNQHVCEEIKDQPYRLIPRKDWFCGAIDSTGFARMLGKREFYHGTGHWTQARTEFSWADNIAINFRSIFYSGSSSQGYASPTGQYNLATLRFHFPERLLGGLLIFRAGDLDRQTVGTGLFLQEKETNGAMFLWDFDHAQFMWRQESTGWFVLDDDVSNPEIRFLNKKIGIGSFIFLKQDQALLDHRRDPYHYLFTSFTLESWDIEAEVGSRNSIGAGLVGVKREFHLLGAELATGVQARTYGNGFARDLAGQIEHQYVSFDQYNKAYTNSLNIFAKDDHVDVFAGIFNLTYAWNHFHRAGFFNELSQFNYKNIDPEFKHFYRLEYDFYPFGGREDYFAFLVSNKILNTSQSYYRPPGDVAIGSVPLFSTFTYFGIEGTFRL